VTTSDPSVTISIAPDRTTLTTTFSELVASVGSVVSPAPATRSFRLVVPLTGAAQNAKVAFHASGYAVVEEGATARLTFRVNGRTIVKDFPVGSDDDFDQTLELPAIPSSTYQLSVVLETQQVPGSDDGTTASLNVSTIDARIT
jgi:hypothetical protein